MNRLTRWRNAWLRRRHGARLLTWYHPDYRLPITSLGPRTGLEPRRADLVVWYLLEVGAIARTDLFEPIRASWQDIGRVHDADYLESLTHADALARTYGVESWDVPVDEVLGTVRLVVGATLAASRQALSLGGAVFNLLGGMHHAARARGGGFCPVNDVAIAIAVLRDEGFAGRVAIVDVDAHPPDGTADCVQGDARTWLGSISGADWGPLAGEVDETVLPAGSGDQPYLAALDGLLARMPAADLTFVLAGGDVVASDRVGPLGVSEAGAAERDRRIHRALGRRPAVWLGAGGYGDSAWRVLAGTGLVLALGRARPMPATLDPMRRRFAEISRSFRSEDLEGSAWLSEADLAEALGMPSPAPRRLLGFYTAQGVELALSRYGVLHQLRRLGYARFHVVVDRASSGDRVRLFGEGGGQQHVLIEEVLHKERLDVDGQSHTVLFVHWLTLRHPLASFGESRPQLPGQEVPGLGMAREAGEMLRRVAARLDLAGVAVRPAWFHVAYACRYEFRFVNPHVQGRFEALMRDLAHLSLKAATLAVAEGLVAKDGLPYSWEAEVMVVWRDPHTPGGEAWEALVAHEREGVRFTVRPPPASGEPSR